MSANSLGGSQTRIFKIDSYIDRQELYLACFNIRVYAASTCFAEFVDGRHGGKAKFGEIIESSVEDDIFAFGVHHTIAIANANGAIAIGHSVLAQKKQFEL